MNCKFYPSGEKKSGAVCGGVVGEAHLDAVAWQLVRVGSSHDLIAINAGIRNLTDDVLVGRANNHPVLGRVIFVLVLDDETLASIVVCLALAAPAELDLEPLEVRLVLDKLYERLKEFAIC